MKIYFHLLVCGFFAILLFSCTDIQPLSITGIDKPQVNQLSTAGIDAELGMKINNPNKMSIVVFPSEFEATVNDISVGKVKLYKKVRIKMKSDKVENFRVKSDFSKLGFNDIGKIIPIVTSGTAKIYLKGNIRAGKWFFKKKFPVEFTKTISLKQ